jgi:hypothetical protein
MRISPRGRFGASSKQSGVMGEVQLGAKLNDKEENDMVVLTRS